jgi:hypothetical protein
VSGLANGGVPEGAFGSFFAAEEGLVFEKSGGAEGFEKMLFDLAGFEVAGRADEVLAQVETTVLAVEKFETRDQTGRDDERGVRILKRIADHETGFVGNG